MEVQNSDPQGDQSGQLRRRRDWLARNGDGAGVIAGPNFKGAAGKPAALFVWRHEQWQRSNESAGGLKFLWSALPRSAI